MGKQWKLWLTLFFWAPESLQVVSAAMKLKDAYSLTNLDSILKSRDITLPTKVRLVKAMVFPVIRYGCESWTVKKAEHWRIDAFELWCWRRLLRVSWTARRSNQSILKEISPEYSLDAEWCWCWSWNSNTLATWCEELTHLKRPWCWEKLKTGGEGDHKGWDLGWHQQLNEHKFDQIPGDSGQQRSLACCSPCICKESDTAKQLNNNNPNGCEGIKTLWVWFVFL